MSRALAATPAVEFTITVLSGPDKGTVYRLMGRQATLGRGSDNDIVVGGDPKVSRKHAQITVTSAGIVISDLSEKNRLLVGGEECRSKVLQDNMEFFLGDTKFKFSVVNHQLPAQRPGPTPDLYVAPAPPAPAYSAPTASDHKPRRPGRRNKKGPFPLIVGGLVLFFLWVLFDDGGGKKNQEIELRTEQQIEADIRAAEEMAKAYEQEQKNKGRDSFQYRKAQSFFVHGFRDYQVGQYERALESFQACMSLFPDHALCNRYQGLAQKKFNELIQYHMIVGRKYLEQQQYRACLSSFRNVMFMIKDTNSKVFKEAQANYNTCHAMSEGRF